MEDLPGRNRSPRKSTGDMVSKSFGILMVVLYFALGTTIIFRAPLMQNIPEQYARIFGVLLILYGFFRAYKLYRRYFY